MSDRKSKQAFLDAQAKELDSCHKGIAWNEYCFKCLAVGRKPDRELFERTWKEVSDTPQQKDGRP